MRYVSSAFVFSLLVCVLHSGGCLGPVDVFGYLSGEFEQETLVRQAAQGDDRIEDKNPQYDPESMISEVFDSCKVTMNKSGAVTELDIVFFDDEDADIAEKLFRNRGEALAATDERGGGEVIPSREVVSGAFGAFNHGLYAAVEKGMQEGVSDVYPGRRDFLYDLAGELKKHLEEASGERAEHLLSGLVFTAGALMAGGNDVSSLELGADILNAAQFEVDLFESHPINSTPVGFYDWDPVLREIYRQNRFSANVMHPEDKSAEEFGRYAAMAAVMMTEDASDLRMRYENYLAVYSGLYNSFASYTPADLFEYLDGPEDLDDVVDIRATFLSAKGDPYVCTGSFLALFPVSRSRDSDYFEESFCEEPVPSGINLVDLLIHAVREDELDLEPGLSSGWHDYRLFAMETVFAPERGAESDHLLLTAGYKEKLVSAFNSVFSTKRETRAKPVQGFICSGNPPPPDMVDVYPNFSVEPLPTFYLRTARAYAFLLSHLNSTLGSGFLNSTARMFEDLAGSEIHLADELRRMVLINYGLFIISARSVGLNPAGLVSEDEVQEYSIAESVLTARDWISEWSENSDVLQDPREIVKVALDASSAQTINRAVLGVRLLRLGAEFVEGYEPEIIDQGDRCEMNDFVSHHYYLLIDEAREVKLPLNMQPLTNEEFRSICDKHASADDIVKELEALR